MKIIIKLNHPAHYHLFRILIKELRLKGHKVIIIIKNKDILKQLLELSNEKYIELIEPAKRKSGKISSILFANVKELFFQDFKLFWMVMKLKPDVMLGTDTSIAHVGWLLRIPTYIFNEDDYDVNKMFCFFTYPFATKIISPSVCDLKKYNKKKISYEGYQKLAYLHPNRFKPDIGIASKYINLNKKNFLIRLVNLVAVHDIENYNKGLYLEIIKKLVKLLEEYGNVYILSEEKIPEELIKYSLSINILDIHHVLAFCDLLISDSQSMTLEAAILGTPSIRYNSFVGKISVLNELEFKYNLTIGVKSNNENTLLSKIQELLNEPNLKIKMHERRNKMLLEKIDVTNFFIKVIESKGKI